MPNFARILINILLYIFYVIVVSFFVWFLIPLVFLSFWREIPVYSIDVYNLIFFIIAWLIFLLTFLFRQSCYISLKSQVLKENSQKSYTQEKKKIWKVKTATWDSGEEMIKIYVDKEIK